MNNSISTHARRIEPVTAHFPDAQTPGLRPPENPSPTRAPSPYLDGSEHEKFLMQHAELYAAGRHTLADIHRDFSSQHDLFLLSDHLGRLITLHASSDVMRSATEQFGLRSGALLDEQRCGSNAIAMALRYREVMVSTNSSNVDSPLHLWITVAVPLLDESMRTRGCVAILNNGGGSLGEKLLLAKFVVRELTRVFAHGSQSLPGAACNLHCGEPRRGENALERTRSLSAHVWNRPERRRGEDRRRTRHAASAQETSVKLTRRQQEVLKLFAQGKGYKEIARDIGITSYKTVEEHLDAVREKLKVEHRRECIHKAMSLGLL